MNTKREALELARDALSDSALWLPQGYDQCSAALRAIYAALAAPDPQPERWPTQDFGDSPTEPEPVAWMNKGGHVISARDKTYIVEMAAGAVPGGEIALAGVNVGKSYMIPLYASPPARTPMTDEQIAEMCNADDNSRGSFVQKLVRAVERHHGIGGE